MKYYSIFSVPSVFYRQSHHSAVALVYRRGLPSQETSAIPSFLNASSIATSSSDLILPCNTSKRSFSSSWRIPRYQYTKYRIAKPWSTTTYYDDLFLADPSREDFAKFTKDVPLFLRFLKLVTGLEGRSQSFINYAKRCADGLVVEKDVYITKAELMDCVWRNGYSENEMNAFEIAFPSDYKFHYPELAVLFDLSEEDCYKYCIRQRANNPEELVELNYKSPQNLVSSYGLIFVGVWYGLSNTVLSNAWFFAKTIPFGLVFYLGASYFYRDMKEYFWKEESVLVENANENKRIGEEAVYLQMKKYANDSRCVEFLTSFKSGVQSSLALYHHALAVRHKEALVNRLTLKLVAIRQAEQSIQNSIRESIVKEIVSSFHETFTKQQPMTDAAFTTALQMLSNKIPDQDPVETYFRDSLKQLQSVDIASAAATKSVGIVKKIVDLFQQKEKDFLDAFTVTPQEAEEVSTLVKKCSVDGNKFDFSKLQPKEYQKLQALYESINSKVGFEVVDETPFELIETQDLDSKSYVDHVNLQIKEAVQSIKQNRLTAFAQSFI